MILHICLYLKQSTEGVTCLCSCRLGLHLVAQMAAKLGHWPSTTPLCLPGGQLCSLVPLPVASVGAEMVQMASLLHRQSDSDLLLVVLIP